MILCVLSLLDICSKVVPLDADLLVRFRIIHSSELVVVCEKRGRNCSVLSSGWAYYSKLRSIVLLWFRYMSCCLGSAES